MQRKYSVAATSAFCSLLSISFAIGMCFAKPLAADGTTSTGSPDTALCTIAGQYCVNREVSNATCHVQETTERPQFGSNLKGPFKNRAEGNKAMCALYDPASEDPKKCGAVAPQGVCDAKKAQ